MSLTWYDIVCDRCIAKLEKSVACRLTTLTTRAN